MTPLMSYKKALSLTKEKLDQAMALVHVKQAKQQGALESLKIEEKLCTLESASQEILCRHPLDWNKLIDSLDQIALLERRKAQLSKLIFQLFPEKED